MRVGFTLILLCLLAITGSAQEDDELIWVFHQRGDVPDLSRLYQTDTRHYTGAQLRDSLHPDIIFTLSWLHYPQPIFATSGDILTLGLSVSSNSATSGDITNLPQPEPFASLYVQLEGDVDENIARLLDDGRVTVSASEPGRHLGTAQIGFGSPPDSDASSTISVVYENGTDSLVVARYDMRPRSSWCISPGARMLPAGDDPTCTNTDETTGISISIHCFPTAEALTRHKEEQTDASWQDVTAAYQSATETALTGNHVLQQGVDNRRTLILYDATCAYAISTNDLANSGDLMAHLTDLRISVNQLVPVQLPLQSEWKTIIGGSTCSVPSDLRAFVYQAASDGRPALYVELFQGDRTWYSGNFVAFNGKQFTGIGSNEKSGIIAVRAGLIDIVIDETDSGIYPGHEELLPCRITMQLDTVLDG